jgi:hypothetical protein
MTGSSSAPARYAKPDVRSRSETMKKGNSDGTTTAAQRFRPFAAALTAVSEKSTRQIVKAIHSTGNDSSRIYKVLDGCRVISSNIDAKIMIRKVYAIMALPFLCYYEIIIMSLRKYALSEGNCQDMNRRSEKRMAVICRNCKNSAGR